MDSAVNISLKHMNTTTTGRILSVSYAACKQAQIHLKPKLSEIHSCLCCCLFILHFHVGRKYWHIIYLFNLVGSMIFHAVYFLQFFVGPAEDCTERAGTVGECARADKHKSDNALLQQPHDVLSDQHEVSAGRKPKTHRQRVQPRRTTTVRALKKDTVCFTF